MRYNARARPARSIRARRALARNLPSDVPRDALRAARLCAAGLYVRYVSGLRRVWQANALTAHIDPWGRSLQYLMSAVGVSGICILALFRYIQVTTRATRATSRRA